MTLCYNPETMLRTGYLGFVHGSRDGDLLSSILQTAADAIHPLMLPIPCYTNSISIVSKETDGEQYSLKKIDSQIRKATEEQFLDAIPFPKIHNELIAIHSVLTNSYVDFVKVLKRQIQEELGNVTRMVGARRQAILQEHTVRLKRGVEQMDNLASTIISARERSNYRLDIQFKVVSQHCEITEESTGV